MQRALALSLIQVYAGVLDNEEDTLSKPIMFFIDEPEISLHLLWQDKFIHDVQDILNINNFCMIIATHAPAIIGEHMGDKTVQLS